MESFFLKNLWTLGLHLASTEAYDFGLSKQLRTDSSNSALPEGMPALGAKIAVSWIVSCAFVRGWLAKAWHCEHPSASQCFPILHTAVPSLQDSLTHGLALTATVW